MNTCINCGREFKAVKSTTKYCNDKCRTYYNRNLVKRALTDIKKPLTGTDKLTGTVSDTQKPLTGTDDTDKSLTGTTPAKSKIVNKTVDGKLPFANEEMDKVDIFIQSAIAVKIEQGPNHVLNKGKFADDGAFITYFK